MLHADGVIGSGERLNLAEILSRREREDFGHIMENFLQACLMLEIFLIIIGIAIPIGAMAKARRRRRRAFDPLRFTATTPLGALASLTVISARLMGSDLEEDYFVNSVDASWSMKDFTITADDGPIVVGFHHNDYSVTEVKEALEVNLLGPANKIEQERMRRLVRIVGTLGPVGVTGDVVGARLNHGDLIRTKLNWVIDDGSSLNMFAYNRGSGAITTGADVECVGTTFGRWLR